MGIVYGNVISPYARKVYLTLEHKGVPYESVDVLPHDESPAFRATSPLGKVPGYEDDWVRLPDSSVICDYLEHRYPSPPLYPAGPAERARALWLEEYADTHLQDLLLRGIVLERVIKPLVQARPTDEKRVERILRDKLPRELDYIEEQLGSAAHLVGGRLSIADISIVTAFVNAKYADFEVDEGRWPGLAAYLAGIYDTPLFAHRLEAEAEYLARVRSRES